MQTYDFEQVSPTAWAPLIARGEFSDIPYAKEILSFLQSRSQPALAGFLDVIHEYVPFFEARFKAVSHALVERRATQVMELAAGFSPRGLDPAFRDVTYVEVDLPKMIDQKREIVTALLGSIPAHLKFCRANVLNLDELAQGLESLGPEPVWVTSEGLLRYLTFEEKTKLAENVKFIFHSRGGGWITPDIHLKEWAPDQLRSGHSDVAVGRDLNPNYFDDLAHARAFFEGCGFHVEERPLLEGIRDRVASLPQASAKQREVLETRRIFTMTVRG